MLKENYELPEYISKEANHLILSMLQINSKNRISIKECFEDYWITNKTLPDELKMKLITRSNRRLKTENINLKYKGHHMKTSSHVERSEKKILRTRSNSKFIKDDRKNSSVKLPSLMTKITPNFEESLLYDYNFSIVRQFNGKIPNFLLPIGHSKQQKQKNLKIINLISNGFKLINKKKIESTNSEEKSERIMMRNKQKTMSFIQNNSTKKFYSPYKLTDEYKKPKILIDTQVGNKIKHVANKSTSAKDILFNKTISARKFRMNKMKIEER